MFNVIDFIIILLSIPSSTENLPEPLKAQDHLQKLLSMCSDNKFLSRLKCCVNANMECAKITQAISEVREDIICYLHLGWVTLTDLVLTGTWQQTHKLNIVKTSKYPQDICLLSELEKVTLHFGTTQEFGRDYRFALVRPSLRPYVRTSE